MSEKKQFFSRRKIKIFFVLLCIFNISILQSFLPVNGATSKNIITLNKNIYVLKKGQKYKLKSTVSLSKYRSKKLIWTSSKKAVATVSKKGKVVARKKGTAMITVKIKGTSFKAKCKIVVGTPVKTITLSAKSCTLSTGEKYSIKSSVLPGNASVKQLFYSSTDSKIVTVDSKGVITAKSPGSASIILKTKDGSDRKAYFYVVVKKPASTTPAYIAPTVITVGNPTSNAKILLQWMKDFSTFIKKYGAQFYKSKSTTVSSYEKALATVQSSTETTVGINCHSPIDWALQEMGLEPAGQIYGGQNGFTITSSKTRTLLNEKAEFISKGSGIGSSIQAASEAGFLQTGDILASYIDRSGTVVAHTCVYAGRSAEGYALIYEAGGIPYTIGYTVCGCGPLDYHNYSNYYLTEIMRLK